MSNELTILALYGLLVIVILLVHVLLALPQVGLSYLASPRDNEVKLTGTAGRALRSLENAIAAMVLFAPAVLILQAQGTFSSTTLLMAQIFLVARVLHWLLYLAGLPWVRTAAWLAGFLATAYLYILAI